MYRNNVKNILSQVKISKNAVGSDAEDFVRMYYQDDSNYGIQGRHGDANVFQLGATNEIAGWTISSTTLHKLLHL